MDPRIDAPDVALIPEGGGMRNSYTAACVVRLITEKVRFGWVGGVSAGSSHAVNFLSHDAERARVSFQEFATSQAAGGISSFIRGNGYFNSEYIYETSSLPGEELPLDFDAIAADPTAYRIIAFNAATGETTAWGREDVDGPAALTRRVRASSTLPIIMPTPTVDGEPYVDGALGTSGGIPVDVAEADGFERFLVLSTRPREYRKPPIRYPGTARRILSRYPKVAEAAVTRHERYNASKERLLELERQGRAQLFFPDHMPVSNTDWRLDRLRASYADGEEQTDREWEAWERFLRA